MLSKLGHCQRFTVTIGLIASAWLAWQPPAQAGQPIETHLRAAFPDADAFGDREGTPPAYPAYRQDQLIGYAFLSRDVVPTHGFTARSLNVAVGLALDAVIAGASLVEHHEPILVIGVTDQALRQFVRQYAGLDIHRPVRVVPLGRGDDTTLEGIAGATISSVSLNDAIIGSARAVARSRGLLNAASGPASAAATDTLDIDRFEREDWAALSAAGSIVRHTLRASSVTARLGALGAAVMPGVTDPDATFLTVYLALATPAWIGRNLLGPLYDRLMAEAAPGTQLVFVAAHGLYSIKGTAHVRSGVFERMQLVQGERSIPLRVDRYHRIDRLLARDAPELRETALFVLSPDDGFIPTRTWRLDVAVSASSASASSAVFSFGYELPARHLAPATVGSRLAPPGPTSADEIMPLWQRMWLARAPEVVVLCAALLLLTGMLVLQDPVARRRHHWLMIRIVASGFALGWLGWIAGAQLSVVNVLTFANALLTRFDWTLFLLDPLIFLLWGYVAVALLFWGRGVFCGWLCPFGAMQDLMARFAQALRLPQLRPRFGLHERLWPIKYIAFLCLFAVSLGSMDAAILGAEIEPFKTAISLKFLRPDAWLLYPTLLLAVGLFVERPFCRYLCPLGAALAIPARLRMFEWLKRRRQCGTECQICAQRCPVQAIHPDGHINSNECIYCLRCQTNYFDDSVCPPLIMRRTRRDHRGAARDHPELAAKEANRAKS
ncbi:MAG: 4Fe-4S binding protein [Alphaproteobacteria bacterium]|nr:4Fe-4S binding protein [Alphaproteobacteria bacterium]